MGKKRSALWSRVLQAQQFSGRMPGQDAPEVLAIKPKYEQVRQNYLRICLLASILIFLLENGMFAVYVQDPAAYGGFKTSIPVYLLLYNVIPSVLNFSAVLAAWLVHRNGKRESVQNFAPIAAMVIITSVTASAHCIFPITMALVCLPVFMSAVYGRQDMSLVAVGMGAVGLAAAGLFRHWSPYHPNDTTLVPELVAAYLLLFVVGSLSGVLIKLLNEQKGRLIGVTRAAQEARAQAQEANRAKSEFLANMSHEIRTPLNAILGLTEMVTRKSNEPEIREYAADILQSSNALLALINDILDLSKIESGTIEIRESNYELGSLINDSYNMVAARWQEKQLSATVTCDPALPRMLCGDEYHLRQIIVNLLTNAVKYTDEGGVEMNVAGEENGGVLRLEVRVKDTGIGIRPEDIPKLFDKFNRLDYAKDHKIEGVGLGLSITKRLVELMNGTIQVESVYGVGSTFTVRIPQKVADHTPIGDIHSTYLNIRGEIEEYHQSFEAPDARILVVDDMSINLQVIRKLLEDTKMQIDTAASGRACLKMVCEKRYDLILMDHMMPELSGVETLRAMRSLPGSMNDGVPVIMLTANAMVGAREEYLNAGFVDYLAKPVRGARMERMILRYLPTEKVTLYGDAAAAASADHSFSTARLRELLPEVDVRSGISYCADDEAFYRSMLAEFASGGKDEELERHFAAGDWHSYQISAHALKSAARMVGFNALSEECFALEDAAKKNDLAYITARHGQVMAHFREISSALKSLLHGV